MLPCGISPETLRVGNRLVALLIAVLAAIPVLAMASQLAKAAGLSSKGGRGAKFGPDNCDRIIFPGRETHNARLSHDWPPYGIVDTQDLSLRYETEKFEHPGILAALHLLAGRDSSTGRHFIYIYIHIHIYIPQSGKHLEVQNPSDTALAAGGLRQQNVQGIKSSQAQHIC